MVPNKVTKVGGIQNSCEMWQAGFSLAASPGTKIPPAMQAMAN